LLSPGASVSWVTAPLARSTTQISKSPVPPGRTRPNVQWKASRSLPGAQVGYS
jgi:hypothetical protein